jgi:hypothetical protein
MQVMSKLIGLAGVFAVVTAMAACGSAGGTSNSGGGGGSQSGCTPGKTEACACVGGTMGVQTCKDDGRGFDACQCGTASSSSGTGGATSSSSSGNVGTCGNGTIEPSDHCESPSNEFYCQQDCMNATTSSSSSSSSSSSGDPCAGHVYYAGKYDPTTPENSVWASLPGAGGVKGLDAGNNQCKALNIGADHVCDYEEVLKAYAQGELASIPKGTTAWVQRTTVAMVDGQPSQPGPGGRCNNWDYATNHISDGEYMTFDQQGVPTFHLDNDTVFDDKAPGVHTQMGLPCGGTARSILCCYTACN